MRAITDPAPSATGAMMIRRFCLPLFSIFTHRDAADLAGARDMRAAAGLQVDRRARRRRSAPAAAARCRAAAAPTWSAPAPGCCPAPPRPPIPAAPDDPPRSARSARPRPPPSAAGSAGRNPAASGRRRPRPPVTAAPLIRLHSRCIAVCMRISRCRRSQSSVPVDRRADRRQRGARRGHVQDRLALALDRVGDRAPRRRPSAARPTSPGWPPPRA